VTAPVHPLIAYVSSELAHGAARQRLIDTVNLELHHELARRDMDLAVARSLAALVDKLEGAMVDKNIEGMALEKQRRYAEASVLYEANLRDRFDGSHPYDRLRLYYQSERRHADVIRVCRQYLELPGGDLKLKARFEKWIARAEVAAKA
jgi:hypothetical protein